MLQPIERSEPMTLKIPINISFTGAANLLGIIGVVGSLVFVGLELRQSQVIALSAQQQARTSTLVDIIGAFSYSEQPANWEAFVNNNLAEDNFNLGANAVYQLWMLYENDHLQHELGLIDEGVWVSKVAAMRNLYGLCDYRSVSELALKFSNASLAGIVLSEEYEPC
jgi:hypothetical protein